MFDKKKKKNKKKAKQIVSIIYLKIYIHFILNEVIVKVENKYKYMLETCFFNSSRDFRYGWRGTMRASSGPEGNLYVRVKERTPYLFGPRGT